MYNHLLIICNEHVALGKEVPELIQFAGNWWGERTAEAIERWYISGRRDRQLGLAICQAFMEQTLDNVSPDWP